MTSNAVFVYGLLKPGFSLHHVAEPFVVCSMPGRTRGRLYDARGFGGPPRADGLPAARFDEDGEITGYVFHLEDERVDEALLILDDLEDEGEVYRRVVVDVTTDTGTMRAFAYEYLGPLEGRRDVGSAWTK